MKFVVIGKRFTMLILAVPLLACTSPKEPEYVGRVRKPEDIQAVFDRAKGKIFGVYAKALKQEPGLKGKIVFEIEINPGGAVERTLILQSTFPGNQVVDGVTKIICELNFGKIREPRKLTLTYPMEFLPF